MHTLPNQRDNQSCFIVMWSGRGSLSNRICTCRGRLHQGGPGHPWGLGTPPDPHSRAAGPAPAGGTGLSAGVGFVPSLSTSHISAVRGRAGWGAVGASRDPTHPCQGQGESCGSGVGTAGIPTHLQHGLALVLAGAVARRERDMCPESQEWGPCPVSPVSPPHPTEGLQLPQTHLSFSRQSETCSS